MSILRNVRVLPSWIRHPILYFRFKKFIKSHTEYSGPTSSQIAKMNAESRNYWKKLEMLPHQHMMRHINEEIGYTLLNLNKLDKALEEEEVYLELLQKRLAKIERISREY